MMESDETAAGELECDIPPDYLGDLEEFQPDSLKDEDGLEIDCKYRQYTGQRFFVMFHGTTWANAQKIKAGGFVPSSGGMLGPGVYLSRSFNKASRYPLNRGNKRCVVLMVNVRVGKVKKIDRQNHPLQKTWHKHGYHTAWVPPKCGMVKSGLEEDCVYNPSRIEVLKIIPN